MTEARGGSSWSDATLASLRAQGHRDGGARRAVIELLGRQRCCLTAQEIFDTLRLERRRIGIASVYRSLEQLVREGFVQRIDLGAGMSHFEPLRTDGHHHHHVVCDDCGKVEAFADDELENALRGVEAHSDYAIANHEVVLRGACRDCAPKDTA
jgi:Fur family ferric uptake transcriptional regulator